MRRLNQTIVLVEAKYR